jgi:hypothetical protein
VIHNIAPGYFCAPSVIQAITGADMHSVIMPAINRATKALGLHDEVIEVYEGQILKVLNELGFRTLRYKNAAALGTVGSWGEKYPDKVMMLMLHNHVVAVHHALCFDSLTPTGMVAINHPYTHHKVTNAYMVRPM